MLKTSEGRISIRFIFDAEHFFTEIVVDCLPS